MIHSITRSCSRLLRGTQVLSGVVLCAILGMAVAPVHAATIEVTTSAASGAGSLPDALSNAASGDVIYFAASLDGATLSLPADINVTNKNITIDAMALPTGFIIHGSDAYNFNFNGEGYVLTMRGITFDAMRLTAGNLTIVNLDYFTGQSSNRDLGYSWGGIVIAFGDVNIRNSSFHDNHPTSSQGGALAFGSEGTVRISNSTFFNNSASGGFGGAIYIESPKKLLYVDHSTFASNYLHGAGAGGAVHMTGGSKGYFSSNIFWGNGDDASGTGTDDFDVVGGSVANSYGYNIINTGTGFTLASTDASGDPAFGAFGVGAGRTPSLTPGSGGSAATHRIPSGVNGCNTQPDVDQGGMARGAGSGGACTPGPIELDASGAASASLATRTFAVTTVGSGSVASAPAGITCGATCASTYNERTTVTLTATPAANQFTVGWTGCDYNPTAATCVVTSVFAPPRVAVSFGPAGLTYSQLMFGEASANDGSVAGAGTVTLYGDTFAGTSGDDLVALGRVAITNLPSGLTAHLVLTSSSQATLSFSGNATSSSAADTVTNVGIALANSAFSGNNAAAVSGSARTDLTVRFYDANLQYAPLVFTEAPANNGSVAETAQINLFGGTFANSLTGTYTAANVPAGLTLVVEADSPTQATIYFTGNASSHDSSATVSNVTVAFMDSALQGTTAAATAQSTSPNMTIRFFTGTPTTVAGITYSANSFTESIADIGAVITTASLSLYGDTYTGANGDDLVSLGKAVVTNVPAGLTAVLTRVSSHLVQLSFRGVATSHSTADSVANVTVTFQNSAFTGGSAAAVGTSSRNDIAMHFTGQQVTPPPVTQPTSYMVTANAGTGGSISPGSATVASGGTTTFTVAAATGYGIDAVTGCGGALAGTTFTTGAISSACTVTATFKPATYTVTATAGPGGSISPAAETVSYNQTGTFTLTADSGYVIGSVSGCAGALTNGTYTTGAITADCSITATFAPSGDVIVRSKGGGGRFEWLSLLALIAVLLRRHRRPISAFLLRRHWLPMAVVLLMSIARLPGAHAEEHFYAGGEYGWAVTNVHSDDVESSMAAAGIPGTADVRDSTRNAWKLFGGYHLNRYLGVELGYTHLDEIITQLSNTGPITAAQIQRLVPTSGHGFEGDLVLAYPVTSRFGLFAHAGAWRWQTQYEVVDLDAGTRNTYSDHGWDPVFGAGLQAGLTGHLALRAVADRYRVSDDHAWVYTLGLTWGL